MKRILGVALIDIAVFGCASGSRTTDGDYAPVNGLAMYYEIHGSGKPLVLIHGTSATIESSFGAVLPRLASHRRVIAVEMQAHGHTADIDRPLTFENMADDIAALLRYLRIERADLLGWSMGGNIALATAIRHPDVVRKVIVSGASLATIGMHDEVVKAIRTSTPENVPAEFRRRYERVAPHPEQWPAQIARIKTLWLDWPGFRQDDIQNIGAPVLVMIGDADAVRTEHALKMVRLLQRGADTVSFKPDSSPPARSRVQLAVLPGTGHATFAERPEWVVSIVNTFLDQ